MSDNFGVETGCWRPGCFTISNAGFTCTYSACRYSRSPSRSPIRSVVGFSTFRTSPIAQRTTSDLLSKSPGDWSGADYGIGTKSSPRSPPRTDQIVCNERTSKHYSLAEHMENETSQSPSGGRTMSTLCGAHRSEFLPERETSTWTTGLSSKNIKLLEEDDDNDMVEVPDQEQNMEGRHEKIVWREEESIDRGVTGVRREFTERKVSGETPEYVDHLAMSWRDEAIKRDMACFGEEAMEQAVNGRRLESTTNGQGVRGWQDDRCLAGLHDELAERMVAGPATSMQKSSSRSSSSSTVKCVSSGSLDGSLTQPVHPDYNFGSDDSDDASVQPPVFYGIGTGGVTSFETEDRKKKSSGASAHSSFSSSEHHSIRSAPPTYHGPSSLSYFKSSSADQIAAIDRSSHVGGTSAMSGRGDVYVAASSTKLYDFKASCDGTMTPVRDVDVCFTTSRLVCPCFI